MATKITSINTQIHTDLLALFPLASGYKLLVNPYDIRANPETHLKKGYGVAYDAGINTNRHTTACGYSLQRTFRIVLSRKVDAMDMAPEDKKTAEVNLFEDQYIFLNWFEKNPFIGSGGIYAYKALYTSDSGIQSVFFGESNSFYYLETNIDIEYSEPIT